MSYSTKKAYIYGFRKILKRLKAEGNSKRYEALLHGPCNADEARIKTLCEKFWPLSYSEREVDVNEYVANNLLDEKIAQKYLKELSDLLDKLGWN